jgi:ADP-ribosyl-[dinitrogen reductase] hydrolase
MRTSHSHPLQIAEMRPGERTGRIGTTFCPGKKDTQALTGSWDRDLELDLDAIQAWGAVAVVTLVEEQELRALQVPRLGEAVRERHMAWLHLPIRDVSVPTAAFETQWAGVADGLHARLDSGFDVLVHCRGGLGRAGSIASRLLVERGWEPVRAIKQVRDVRPGAIETVEQEAFVRSLSPRIAVSPSTSSEAIRHRAVGALLGLAIGDAVGTTLEFRARDSFPPLVEMIGGGPFDLKPGQWTDDTSMALALADSLVAFPDLDERDLMARFVRWAEQGEYSCTGECFDIGITVREALARWKRSGNPVAGSTDPGKAGNGSLMRLAPVAVRYWSDRARLRDIAARQSRVTHAAAEAVDACVVFAEMLADAIEGKPRIEVMAPRTGSYAGRIEDIAAGSWRGKAREKISGSGYVAHSLEAALWSVGRTADPAHGQFIPEPIARGRGLVAPLTLRRNVAAHMFQHAWRRCNKRRRPKYAGPSQALRCYRNRSRGCSPVVRTHTICMTRSRSRTTW